MDASLEAYGTIVYLHCVYNDRTVTSRFIDSKYNVAPLNPMTGLDWTLQAELLWVSVAHSI